MEPMEEMQQATMPQETAAPQEAEGAALPAAEQEPLPEPPAAGSADRTALPPMQEVAEEPLPQVVQQRLRRLEELEQREMEETFSRVLQEIRTAYPKEKAQHLGELGVEFMAIMASGMVSPLAAYEAVLAQRRRSAAVPPSMGEISAAVQSERSFYTVEEVRAMSPAQVRRNFEAIRRSMRRW